MDRNPHPDLDAFYEALLSLETVEQCQAFFQDICTVKELQAMSQRFRVAGLLDSGRNYLEVSDLTGASSATISRVSRCLNCGTGYRHALDTLRKTGGEST